MVRTYARRRELFKFSIAVSDPFYSRWESALKKAAKEIDAELLATDNIEDKVVFTFDKNISQERIATIAGDEHD